MRHQRREPKQLKQAKQKKTPSVPDLNVATLTPMSLGFVRGIAPEKWLRRWRSVPTRRPLNLVPIDAVADIDPATTDMTLVRSWPGLLPARTAEPNPTRHAVKLYEETVSLVIPARHDLAEFSLVTIEELDLITLLDHPGHDPAWPVAEAWKNPAWKPQSITAALELVATGLGGILMPGPLAQHLTSKHDHRVLPVSHDLPGSSVFATWDIAHDSDDLQELVGVLRGRTSRSSR